MRSFLCPGAVLSPSGSLPSWQVPSCSVSPQERTAKGCSLLDSLTPFYSPFFKWCGNLCHHKKSNNFVFVCVLQTPKILEFLSVGLQRERLSSLVVSPSLFALLLCFFFLFPSRPSREEGKTLWGWDARQKQLSALSVAALLLLLSHLLSFFFSL